MSISKFYYKQVIKPWLPDNDNSENKPSLKITSTDNTEFELQDILNEKKHAVIEKSGRLKFRFETMDKIKNMGPHVVLKDGTTAYSDNYKNLETLEAGGDLQGKTFAAQNNLRDSEITQLFLQQSEESTDKITNGENPLNFEPVDFDDYLNAANLQITYLSEVLNKDVKELEKTPEKKDAHYKQIDQTIETLKDHLEAAFKELEQIVSVCGQEEVQDLIDDFIASFTKGYNLYLKFEEKKRTDPSLLDLKLWIEGGSVLSKRGLNLWMNHDIISKLFTYGLINALQSDQYWILLPLILPFIPLLISRLLPTTSQQAQSLGLAFITAVSLITLIYTGNAGMLKSNASISIAIDEIAHLLLRNDEDKPIDIFKFNNDTSSKLPLTLSSADTQKFLEEQERTGDALKVRKLLEILNKNMRQAEKQLDALEQLLSHLEIGIKNLNGDVKELLPFATIPDFLSAINITSKTYRIDGYNDPQGNLVFLNNKRRYYLRDLENEDTLRTLFFTLRDSIIPYQKQTITHLVEAKEDVIDDEDLKTVKIATSERKRNLRAPNKSSEKPTFDKYTKVDRQKFFSKLSRATIVNNQFIDLDDETRIFLLQLCDNFKDYTKPKSFKAALSALFESSTETIPGEKLMNAFEYEAAGNRTR